jgi:hypothetical protein
LVETSVGKTDDAPGFINTSSKARYSGKLRGMASTFQAAKVDSVS